MNFKIGDKIKCLVNRPDSADVKIGEIGEVTGLQSRMALIYKHSYDFMYKIKRIDFEFYGKECNFELVNKRINHPLTKIFQ